MTTTYEERLAEIESLLRKKFHGKVKFGNHDSNGECCILELESYRRGIKWTDKPDENRCIDIRQLNDIDVSIRLRSEWMPRVLAAWQDSLDWPKAKLKAATDFLVIGLVREIIAEVPGLPDNVREKCRAVKTLKDAAAASRAAASRATARRAVPIGRVASTYAAADAADAAASAAPEAARASGAAVGLAVVYITANRTDCVFIAACKLWIAAGRSVENWSPQS